MKIVGLATRERKMKPARRIGILAAGTLMLSASACKTAVSTGTDSVYLPFLKNTANECYYLDEFMPVPDGLVSGKNGSLDLRYYSYKLANYKEWRGKEIMLSFYSRNGKC